MHNPYHFSVFQVSKAIQVIRQVKNPDIKHVSESVSLKTHS